MANVTDDDYQAILQQVDALVQEFERLPFPEIRERVFDLLQGLDLLHREALTRLVDFLREQGEDDLVERAAQDPVVQTLLLLYDLVPSIQLPDAGQAPAPGMNFIPLEQIDRAAQRQAYRPTFKEVARLDEVPAGTMKKVEVDGVHVLLTNVEGRVYAFRDNCPGSMAPLHLGTFSPPVVICPWHNEAFDVRTGRRADGVAGPELQRVASAVSDGSIQVDVNLLSDSSAPGGPWTKS